MQFLTWAEGFRDEIRTDHWVQGVWFALAHRPDRVMAAVVVSAYSSIQSYVPFTFWPTTEPAKSFLVQAAMNSFRHELLVPRNAKGISIALQHGTIDDNVPAYQSRHMQQLLLQAGDQAEYKELSGRGHWFDGVMTTKYLQGFISKAFSGNSSNPRCLEFSLDVSDPGLTGSKCGLRVTQIFEPGRLSKIDGLTEENRLILNTTNVRRMTIKNDREVVLIDGQPVKCASRNTTGLIKRGEVGADLWSCSTASNDNDLSMERFTTQFGGINALLGTNGPFTIQYTSRSAQKLALMISQNLLQYFGADSILENDRVDANKREHGNLITIGVGNSVGTGYLTAHPIVVSTDSLAIRDARGAERVIGPSVGGLGAIYLRPLQHQRLELVIWGTDYNSLFTASKLMPLMTGTGQPDFVVTTVESRWRGLDGAAALGFFDFAWNVSSLSYL